MRKILIILCVLAFVAVGCNTSKEPNEPSDQNQQENNQVTNNTEITDVSPVEDETTSDDKEVTIAPDFELETLDGTMIKLSELKGKNVIINFWATWCDFCVAEMPDLQKLQDTYKDDDLLILAVNVGDAKEDVEKFIEENNLTLTVLLDKDSEIANNYGLRSFPSSLAVNKDGEIVTGYVGMLTYEQMETMYGYFNN
jgi:peroxiredoxin